MFKMVLMAFRLEERPVENTIGHKRFFGMEILVVYISHYSICRGKKRYLFYPIVAYWLTSSALNTPPQSHNCLWTVCCFAHRCWLIFQTLPGRNLYWYHIWPLLLHQASLEHFHHCINTASGLPTVQKKLPHKLAQKHILHKVQNDLNYLVTLLLMTAQHKPGHYKSD